MIYEMDQKVFGQQIVRDNNGTSLIKSKTISIDSSILASFFSSGGKKHKERDLLAGVNWIGMAESIVWIGELYFAINHKYRDSSVRHVYRIEDCSIVCSLSMEDVSFLC